MLESPKADLKLRTGPHYSEYRKLMKNGIGKRDELGMMSLRCRLRKVGWEGGSSQEKRSLELNDSNVVVCDQVPRALGLKV